MCVAVRMYCRIVRLGGRRVEHAVGGAWHTVIRTDTGESYVMGCILPAGEREHRKCDGINLCRTKPKTAAGARGTG